MKSEKRGKRTSAVEVTNVSKHGFWLLIEDTKRFVRFEQFPWFRNARINHLLNVELPSVHHLYWPELDVDLAVESIAHPERFSFSQQSATEPGIAAATPKANAPLTRCPAN